MNNIFVEVLISFQSSWKSIITFDPGNPFDFPGPTPHSPQHPKPKRVDVACVLHVDPSLQSNLKYRDWIFFKHAIANKVGDVGVLLNP